MMENQRASSRVGSRAGDESPQQGPFSPPAISLPKGGGAIRGIGEKFAANPVTGTGSFSVPIATSPGRSGFGPQLSLSYDSGAGNGPFGFGWSLSLPSITRKTDKGLPQYRDAEDSDVFVLSGAEDLVPEFKKDAAGNWVVKDGKHVIFDEPRTVGDVTYRVRRYRPRIEGLLARIERWTNTNDPNDVHWRSISKDNILTLYGKDANSRIADPTRDGRIFSWLICETRDDKGNAVIYEYKEEDGVKVDLTQAHERNRGDREDPRRAVNRYLKRIHYGNRQPLLDEGTGKRLRFLSDDDLTGAGWMFEVVFDYGEHDAEAPQPDGDGEWPRRNDPFSSYRAGFEVRTYRLCQRVLVFHHIPNLPTGEEGYDGLVRSTDFDYSYEQSPDSARDPVYSFLLSVTQSGYRRQNGGYLKRSLPPLEFEYTRPIVQETVETVDAASLENLPIGLDGGTYQWTDLHGEGIPGILTEQGGGWFYKRNISPVSEHPVEFAPLERVATQPNLSLVGGRAQFMDLAGDGQPDLVVLDGPTPGFYEHDGDESWQPFRPFTSLLNRDTRDPNLKLVDLDGNGHADVLLTEDDVFVWHASLVEEGFGPAHRVHQALDEEKGPRLVFADGTQSIYLADLSGDGLTDLARIRNGEVCYWPNLGYGRFGAKVAMDNVPHLDSPDQFDQRRVRLADIDGSGTTDIIYLGRDGVRLTFNQSGNSWSAPQRLDLFPQVDNLAAITPVDLRGNGTACLVWSSPLPGDGQRPMRYVDLMGRSKPHLLVKIVNNLGAETRVDYASSTKFYLQDRRAGKPWITRLPFPVHVVERVTTYDHVSRNRFASRYAYHHGYFDGEEREFRGFGMVEQWDTEEYGTFEADGSLDDAENLDQATHVPPVRTKTWFHTGTYLGRDQVSNYFAGLLDEHDVGEYYREPAWQYDDKEARKHLLPDTVLPDGLTVAEEREACRALKGSMLRQEVFALDGTDEEPHPYTVTEQNFTIEKLQPHGANRHAVFFTHPREALTYHYERNPEDPRIGHALTLEVDEYGNVRKSVAIGYGRRLGQSPLSGEDLHRQEQSLVTYRENDVTKAITDIADYPDDYRTPLPCETRTYEVTGFDPADNQVRLDFATIAADDCAILVTLPEIEYEVPANYKKKQKRLIERVRTRYRADNLTRLLDQEELQPLALPGESYQLAFTRGLLDAVYRRGEEELLPESERSALLGGTAGDQGGYVDLDGDGHWWIPSGRVFYHPKPVASGSEQAEARDHFFLPRRYTDPFGQSSTVDFDIYDLLMVETRDALRNRVTAGERDGDDNITAQGNDYRVLQPSLLSGPNRNRTAVAFDTLGLVAGTAVMGKPPPDPVEDDLLEGDFEPDLTQAQIDEFYDAEDPHIPAPDQLKKATTRIIYDLDRFWRTRRDNPDNPERWLPAYAATLARETHVSKPAEGQETRIQISFSYSDGFGREIQKKIQAEPGPVEELGENVDPRWVGSGWTVFNNKGKPVRQYEPFFCRLEQKRHHFEFGVKAGVSPVLFYDPVGRVVATLHPNHTYEKVVFDPWQQTTYDANDTVAPRNDQTGDPRTDPDIEGYVRDYFKEVREYFEEQPGDWQTWYAQRIDGQMGAAEGAAARKAALHADTPTVAHFDALGRPFLTVADNGLDSDGNEQKYETRVLLDIEGNQREVIDAKGRVVMRYEYYMAGPADDQEDAAANRIHQASMDAGERWMLSSVAGNPIRGWDSRGFTRRMTYDALRRPLELRVSENGRPEFLAEKTVYGEDKPDSDPELTNHRTRTWRVYDGAGLVTSQAYDFKGNLRISTRQLLETYQAQVDWLQSPAVEEEVFTTSTTYDALNRPLTVTSPDGSVYHPIFSEANLLNQVYVHLQGAADATSFVTNIDYDAKGQRTRIEYNKASHPIVTDYTYDPHTFRLTHLLTRRPMHPETDKRKLQDLSCAYDPVGNITSIRDDAQPRVFFDNDCIDASNDYQYDALYRLIGATGREHRGQDLQPDWDDSPRTGNRIPYHCQELRRYTEIYRYDEVGNILKMVHHLGDNLDSPGSVVWNRRYQYQTYNNRLRCTSIPGETDQPEYSDDSSTQYSNRYTYDEHGNMKPMPHLPLMEWDYKDQLCATSQQIRHGGGTPEITYYVYDAAGQRVRKVTERQAAPGAAPVRKDERIYLGGFEIYREYNGSNGDEAELQRETLHIMDDQQRIALVETRTKGDDDSPGQLLRYQFGNHLGSATLELDQNAVPISYEEYYPYGSTSYQAVDKALRTAAKRYRYTGKERDEESGLYYYGARYYASWLGRWTGTDPSGLVDGVNLFVLVGNNPLGYHDPTGKQKLNLEEYESAELRDINLTPGDQANLDIDELQEREHSPDEIWITTTRGRKNRSPGISPELQELLKIALPEEHMNVLLNATPQDFEIYSKAYDVYLRLSCFEDEYNQTFEETYEQMHRAAVESELDYDEKTGELSLIPKDRDFFKFLEENILKGYMDKYQGEVARFILGEEFLRRIAWVEVLGEGQKIYERISNKRIVNASGAKGKTQQLEIKLRIIAEMMAEDIRYRDPMFAGKLLDRYYEFEASRRNYQAIILKYMDPSERRRQRTESYKK